ncbi:hypothetical protein AHF37_10708 [Paragonimus kellicotti]|nr:hypothetical protein AHF37_10708 [Paragonimus kellicotti]
MDSARGFYIPLAVVSIFWLLVAILGPVFVPKGPHRTLIVVSTLLTAGCCYIFWLGIFLAQYKPIFGPVLARRTLFIMERYWKVLMLANQIVIHTPSASDG